MEFYSECHVKDYHFRKST